MYAVGECEQTRGGPVLKSRPPTPPPLGGQVHGMVKTGKEAHVYHALAYEDPETLTGTRGVALKIFKTTLSEFGNRAAYVDGDPR